ncbi:hypothetical protein GALL_424280 [mine drainage metagenome]|uniref:Uncharacterized protein n=1 Tax=mine drainage metagenome TaxID=410659 RepID=A0A1J5Q7C2_9ZZZZ
MEDVRRSMKNPTQPVPAEIPHHRHPMCLDIRLNRVADIAERIARLHCLNPLEQRVMGDLNQPLCLTRQAARDIHPARIAEPAIKDHRHIDVQNVAVGNDLWPRNAVADDMVDRNTRGVFVALVANRRRNRARCCNAVGDVAVNFLGGDAGHHQGRDLIKDFRREATRSTHASEILCLVYSDAVLGNPAAGIVHG